LVEDPHTPADHQVTDGVGRGGGDGAHVRVAQGGGGAARGPRPAREHHPAGGHHVRCSGSGRQPHARAAGGAQPHFAAAVERGQGTPLPCALLKVPPSPAPSWDPTPPLRPPGTQRSTSAGVREPLAPARFHRNGSSTQVASRWAQCSDTHTHAYSTAATPRVHTPRQRSHAAAAVSSAGAERRRRRRRCSIGCGWARWCAALRISSSTAPTTAASCRAAPRASSWCWCAPRL
jgi:hypothetical protein